MGKIQSRHSGRDVFLHALFEMQPHLLGHLGIKFLFPQQGFETFDQRLIGTNWFEQKATKETKS